MKEQLLMTQSPDLQSKILNAAVPFIAETSATGTHNGLFLAPEKLGGLSDAEIISIRDTQKITTTAQDDTSFIHDARSQGIKIITGDAVPAKPISSGLRILNRAAELCTAALKGTYTMVGAPGAMLLGLVSIPTIGPAVGLTMLAAYVGGISITVLNDKLQERHYAVNTIERANNDAKTNPVEVFKASSIASMKPLTPIVNASFPRQGTTTAQATPAAAKIKHKHS